MLISFNIIMKFNIIYCPSIRFDNEYFENCMKFELSTFDIEFSRVNAMNVDQNLIFFLNRAIQQIYNQMNHKQLNATEKITKSPY